MNPQTNSTDIELRPDVISALIGEVQVPLANIKLSVEMLETLSKDNKLKLYFNIISRSAARIDAFANKLVKYQQAKETERMSFE